jgi:hypothetical protein
MNKIIKFVVLGLALVFAIGMVKFFVVKAVSMIIGILVIAGLGYAGYRMFIK